MAEKVLYEELTPKEFLERMKKAPIAYLPLGTLEWHGEHLPLGSDGIQSQGFMVELAKRVGGIVLPMIFLGPENYWIIDGKEYFHMDMSHTVKNGPKQLPGSAHRVGWNFLAIYLKNIFARLRRAGFRIIVAHGHGPSTGLVRKHLEEWSRELDVQLFHCWRDVEDDNGIQTDHAATNETSLVMALRPELVQMENLSKDPNDWPEAVHGRLDPREHASPKLGNKAIDMQADRMEKLLRKALAKCKKG